MKAGLRHWMLSLSLPLCLAACPLVGAAEGSPAVSLVFAGDVVLDDSAGELIQRGGDPFADFAALFASADIRLANLECVVATTGCPFSSGTLTPWDSPTTTPAILAARPLPKCWGC
jgi:hypothetical protein